METKIRKANNHDIEDVVEIYLQAREYMKEQGNSKQWGDSYPSKSLISKDIAEGKCYVCENDTGLGAVFYFAIENDPCYDIIKDGMWRNDRAYGVVHRIAVGESMHGRGIAGKCISYAVNECRRQGIYDLRMDTHEDNIPMQHFFTKNDFRKCGIVYMEDGSERLAYHKIIIRNVVFDIGQVLLEFDWRNFISNMDISDKKKEQLTHVTLGNMAHWNEHDRGMSDVDFIEKSLLIEPDIKEELSYYLKNIGTIVKEYDYSVPLIRKLKEKGYGVYLLSNYGVTPFKYALDNMKFFDEVDGMVISHEVGIIKPEPEIYKIFLDKYNLTAGECIFIDDREDNIAAAFDMGISGIVFNGIEEATRKLGIMLCESELCVI